MANGRILLADDEEDIIWAVGRTLIAAGYDLVTAANGLQALTLARRHKPNLLILDILMPHLDGLQLCEILRQEQALASTPILFLTSCSAVEQRIKGLDRGGDDYLVKPFDLGELKARVKALLRRPPVYAPQAVKEDEERLLLVGSFALDLDAYELQFNNELIRLTPAEFNLFYFLMQHPGQVFSTRRLLQQVWGYTPGTAEPSLVRWHVKNLRAKIEPDPNHPAYICTTPHRGYGLKVEG